MSAEPTPPTTAPGPLPAEAYRKMTLVLRVGLLSALAILLSALAAYLLENPAGTSAGTISSNPITSYLTLAGLAHGLATGAPEAYLALGTFVLIATPLLRVATGIYYFGAHHERTLTAVTVTVMILLLLGILVIGPLIH